MSATGLVDPSKLPPTESTAFAHSLRVYYQCLVWGSLDQFQTDPGLWGWQLDDGAYSPIVTTSDCAPENILQFIRCKCKSGCHSNLCSCRKHGLKCVFACKNCRGDCGNGEVNIIICIYFYICNCFIFQYMRMNDENLEELMDANEENF